MDSSYIREDSFLLKTKETKCPFLWCTNYLLRYFDYYFLANYYLYVSVNEIINWSSIFRFFLVFNISYGEWLIVAFRSSYHLLYTKLILLLLLELRIYLTLNFWKIKNYTNNIVILINIYLLFYLAIKTHINNISIKSLMQQSFHIFLLSLYNQTFRIL